MDMTVEQSALSGVADLSFWSLFINAGFVVQFVIVGLVALSILSWAVIIERSIFFRVMRTRMQSFEKRFWSGLPIDELYDYATKQRASPLANIFVAVINDWRQSQSSRQSSVGLEARGRQIERLLRLSVNRQASRFEPYLGFLATVGSSSPFIGLFGTVWGIMTSFQAIAVMRSTNIAVVAPFIAEALLATAVGLFAAIPAVIAYNRLSSRADLLIEQIETFGSELSSLLLRQLESSGLSL